MMFDDPDPDPYPEFDAEVFEMYLAQGIRPEDLDETERMAFVRWLENEGMQPSGS